MITQINKTTTTKKVVISNSTVATTYLRDYFRSANFNSSPYYTVGKSKARWASVAQIVEWYRTSRGINLDAGWFGRSLNAAESDNMAVTSTSVRTAAGKNVNVYRNVRS